MNGLNLIYIYRFCEIKIFDTWPWLVWLSWLCTVQQRKRSLAVFPVRAHVWVVGSIPVGCLPGQHTLLTLMLLGLSSLPSPLSKNTYIKLFLKKYLIDKYSTSDSVLASCCSRLSKSIRVFWSFPSRIVYSAT